MIIFCFLFYVFSDEGNYTIHPCYVANADDRSVVVYVLLSNFTDFIEKESGASIRITNCGFECINATFRHCVSTEGGGGAIYIKNKLEVSNDINLRALHFTKCQALYGGAVYLYCSSSSRNVNITSCTFTQNSISGSKSDPLFGGFHLFVTAKTLNVQNSTFHKGTGNHKGGSVKIYNVFDDDDKQQAKSSNSNPEQLTIESCMLENENGGLVADLTGQSMIKIFNTTFDNSTLVIKQTNANSPTTVNNCAFTNFSEQSSLCFNLSIQSTSFTFDNNIIQSLICKQTTKYFGIMKTSLANLEIHEMKFVNNSCDFIYESGFGIQIESITNLTFIDCEFINNKAEQDRTTRIFNKNHKIISNNLSDKSVVDKSDKLNVLYHQILNSKTLNIENDRIHKGSMNDGGSIKISNFYDDNDGNDDNDDDKH